mmetsp:Transcript_5465/g.12461  ORF Transcript_5465/g.12461 Transcript_5465/m.12461 type:complete len:453 (+) Transcript_5465:99-1457(+)|eukprot:CAMPEP_0172308576 /NCGR_PEP_ID=MMETSP1058-20130122/9124_1 /TAXON_ID=83371 /ORGANISM="Detonula confervacea, Strain CCMP 353" /LENGTH=452 /DNA_ID=CAMNT_0013021019 /DNA_START=178 /DNA_END=1536 /DNA_ORIENTATION=+
MHPPYLHLALFSLITVGHSGTASARRLYQREDSDVDSSPAVATAAAAQSSPNSIEDDEPPLELPLESESLIAMQFTDDPYAHRDHMEMIQNGELGLAAIRYSHTSFVAGGADADAYAYTEVQGEFCVFDSSLSKQDPAKYPTMNAIMSDSDHCGEHRYMMPLREVMHDASSGSNAIKSLPVSGLLFHEGYSGAGLISNALATFDSTLVISEHPAIRDALSACDVIRNRYKSDNCSPLMQQQLVQDVISLLSRTSNTSIQHLYLKLSSTSAAYLPAMRSLYPDANWAFVYRNADDALAKATQRNRSSTCKKAQRNPSMALSAKSNEYNVDLEQLSHYEVCSLQLSSLLDTASKEHDESGTGMLISYDDDILSNANNVVHVILPYLGLQEDIEANPQVVSERVSEILSLRSNASGMVNPEDKQWGGESIEISEEVGTASKVFLKHSMDSIMRMR